MFVCAVLVLFMQAGFAMLEVDSNAAKNTINILFKNVMDLSVGVLLSFRRLRADVPGSGLRREVVRFWRIGIGGLGMATATSVDATAPYSPSADFLFQVAFAATPPPLFPVRSRPDAVQVVSGLQRHTHRTHLSDQRDVEVGWWLA